MRARVRTGDWLTEITHPADSGSVVVAGVGDPRCGRAMCDETEHGSVLVDVSPAKVLGDAPGVWMRVGDRTVVGFEVGVGPFAFLYPVCPWRTVDLVEGVPYRIRTTGSLPIGLAGGMFVLGRRLRRILPARTERRAGGRPARHRHHDAGDRPALAQADRGRIVTRVVLVQTDRWVNLSSTRGVYARDRCCYCYASTRPHARLLRTARTNDGEWWLISSDVDLTTDEWKDFQHHEGDRLPTLLPVGSGCLRDHPEWAFALAHLVERSL